MDKEKTIPIKELLPLLMAIFIDILGFRLAYPVLAGMMTSTFSILPMQTSDDVRSIFLSLGYFLYPLFMLFGASFLGDLSDSFGRKKVLVICTFFLTLGFLLMAVGAYLEIIAIFMIGRALSGLMAGSRPVAQAAVADFSSGVNKARSMAIITFTASLGLIFGSAIAGVFSDRNIVHFFGYWTPFIFAALLAFMTFIWILFGFYESYKPKVEKKVRWNESFIMFKEAFSHSTIRVLCPLLILMQIGIATYLQYMIVYFVESYHYSTYQTGMFNFYLGIGFTIGLLIIVPILVKKFVIEKIIFWTLLISAISVLATVIYPKEIFIWILALPLAIASNVAFSMIMTTFSNQVSQEIQGRVMGIFGASIAVAFTLAGVTAILLPFWKARGLLFFGAICFFISTLLMYIFNRRYTLYGPSGAIIKN